MDNTTVALSTAVFIVTFPLCLCLYIIMRVFSFVFYLLAMIKYGNKVFRPSAMDVLAGMSSDLSRPYYNVVFSLEGRQADIVQIRRHYSDRLFKGSDKQQTEAAKKWRSNLRTFCGYYVWLLNDHFDVKNHIRLVTFADIMKEQSVHVVDETADSSGKWADILDVTASEKKMDIGQMSWEDIVHRFVTTYGSRELQNMPKWELLVLEENENRYTCLFRVHHSICDGMHFGKMLTKLICDEELTPMQAPVRQRVSVSFFNRVRLAVRSFCLLPYGLWAGAIYKDVNPLHGKQLSGRKSYFVSKPIPLDKMKGIKMNLGVTVNDIAVSCVSKAVTCHFENISVDVPEVTSLLPMSRASIDEDSMAMKNDVAITSVKLPTYRVGSKPHTPQNGHEILANFCRRDGDKINELNSILRLAIVQNNLKEAKTNPTTMAICWFLMTITSHLPAWLSNAIVVMDGLTLNVSNVRGPAGDRWTIAKSLLKDFTFLLNDKDPLGLAVSVLSFNDSLRVGLIIDDALMTKTEGQNFIDNILTEVNNLKNEANILSDLRKYE